MFPEAPAPGRLKTVARAWRGLLGRADVLILDTETTGLPAEPAAEVIEVAAIDTTGAVRIEALALPSDGAVPEEAARIHGLTARRLADESARPWPAVHAELEAAMRGVSLALAYNVAFDRKMLLRTAERHGLTLPEVPWRCILTDARPLYPGRRGKLADMLRRTGAPEPAGRAHRALNDCLAVLALMRRVVEGAPRLQPEPGLVP